MRPSDEWSRPFRDVVALMAVYNEVDIIEASVRKLVDQGIGVYLVDNWSTDGTLEVARMFLGHGLIGCERFPRGGPSPHWEWGRLLRRKEELHRELGARWYTHCDADEVRHSPWPGVSLLDGIRRVDAEGFNCIDYVLLNFRPTDDAFVAGCDMEAHFRYYELGSRPGHFVQMRTWKNVGQPIDLARSGGHDVAFAGKRVYPVRFILKHYPVRGQEHGLRKMIQERRARRLPAEAELGWNGHYDGIRGDHRFVCRPQDLLLFDEVAFKQAHLDACERTRSLEQPSI